MKPSITTPELLSALADGQLGDEALDAALRACAQDESALGCWNIYHAIGDVLRSPASLPAAMAIDTELKFLDRFNKRLEQEVPLMPEPVLAKAIAAPVLKISPDLIHHHGNASNDGNFRWKLVAGFASLAAVSAIAWNTAGLMAPSSLRQLAQASLPQILVSSPQGPMVRDARLQELLAAHKQFGATSAFQESSGFLRNATFEVPQEAQAAAGH